MAIYVGWNCLPDAAADVGAGLGGASGQPADPRAVAVVQANGDPAMADRMVSHRARRMTDDMLLHADYLLVMDEENYGDVCRAMQLASQQPHCCTSAISIGSCWTKCPCRLSASVNALASSVSGC